MGEFKLQAKQEDVNEIYKTKFFQNPYTGPGGAGVKGTSILGRWNGGYGIETCNFNGPQKYFHYQHCSGETAEDMAKDANPAGHCVCLVSSIGNLLADFIHSISINIRRLFLKLNAIAKVIEGLPTKEEYQESRKDDQQILGLLKLMASRQGFTPAQISDLRPIEYEPLHTDDQGNVSKTEDD